ncbi:PH domain-like protein [Lichtheimia hyalospora FSU 10163]|nr:PH domain-like protein [Lichtheimia hyalospora FSU 10163]
MTDDISIKKPRPMSMPPLMMDIDDEPPDYLESVIHLPRWEKCKSLVLPREEGHEELPPYKCTVFKMGPVRVKPEMDAPGVQTRWRHWRKYYIEVWGTMLRVYNSDPNSRASMLGWWLRGSNSKHQKPQPIMTMSLAGAEAKRALDYAKRPHVLRLTLADGPQWLVRLPSKVEMISWIEHMQAAINISLDLEQRPMPKFITLPHRRLAADTLTPRAVELELARERRRMAQHEILI